MHLGKLGSRLVQHRLNLQEGLVWLHSHGDCVFGSRLLG